MGIHQPSPSQASRRPRSRASSTSSSAPALPKLDPSTFLRGVIRRVDEGIPADFPAFHSTAHSYMAQMWSGNKQLHYEAWLRERLAVIEVGLHFEADALTNARLLAAFQARDRAIRRTLGAEVRIESWDKGWARVWEPVELAELDRDFLELIGARVAAYVEALEPVLRAEVPSDVAWTEPRRRR
ncbi:MAG: hypothetical protein E6J15_10655 [Chloroflexi bacterium]|nr:MAG: hypothetical protein E6J15_10655 [Chloroflexota bacterium]